MLGEVPAIARGKQFVCRKDVSRDWYVISVTAFLFEFVARTLLTIEI